MNGETKCSYCGCFCQGFKGPDGKIYCADCYNKKWGKYPWEWTTVHTNDTDLGICQNTNDKSTSYKQSPPKTEIIVTNFKYDNLCSCKKEHKSDSKTHKSANLILCKK